MKWLGAFLIMAGCSSIGGMIAYAYLREEHCLRQLYCILDYFSCELQFRLTPLPELCHQAGRESSGPIQKFFSALAVELENQISPDVNTCVNAVLSKSGNLPALTSQALFMLGQTLGRFNLDGQLKGLDSVRQECCRYLKKLETNRESRLHSYQTLGICAGAALVIIFI